MSPSRRAGHSGVTLGEMLVSCAVFSGVLVMLVLVEQLTNSARSKVSVETLAYRAAMTCVERIRTELRGALIVEVGEDYDTSNPPQLQDARLNYMLPKLQSPDSLATDSTGALQWLPPAPTDGGPQTYYELFYDNASPTGAHKLFRLGNGLPTQLVYLGNKGSLQMVLPNLNGKDLVTFVIHSEVNDPTSPLRSAAFDLTFSMRFMNQSD